VRDEHGAALPEPRVRNRHLRVATEIPASSRSPGVSMWKVTGGHGGLSACPSDIASPPAEAARHPPVARRRRSHAIVAPVESANENPPSGVRETDSTPCRSIVRTPAARAARGDNP